MIIRAVFTDGQMYIFISWKKTWFWHMWGIMEDHCFWVENRFLLKISFTYIFHRGALLKQYSWTFLEILNRRDDEIRWQTVNLLLLVPNKNKKMHTSYNFSWSAQFLSASSGLSSTITTIFIQHIRFHVNRAANSDFETCRRRHQRSKTGVSVAPQKDMCLTKNF